VRQVVLSAVREKFTSFRGSSIMGTCEKDHEKSITCAVFGGKLVRREGGSRFLRLVSLSHGGLHATPVWRTVLLNGAWSLMFLVLRGLKLLCAINVTFAHLTNDIQKYVIHVDVEFSARLVIRDTP